MSKEIDIIREELYDINEARDIREIALVVISRSGPYDAEAEHQRGVERKIKNEMKRNGPGPLSQQCEFWSENDKKTSYMTEDMKAIRFGKATGGDMVADLGRRSGNLKAANDMYFRAHDRLMPLIGYTLPHNTIAEVALDALSLIPEEDKNEEA